MIESEPFYIFNPKHDLCIAPVSEINLRMTMGLIAKNQYDQL